MLSERAASVPLPKVLVVDDDISVRQSLEGLIKEAGWCPYTFASAEDFLSRDVMPGPSCLILDVQLPNIDGLELQSRVADRTDMPVIFISGHGDVPMTVRAMRAGAVEFLTKPCDVGVLLSAVSKALCSSQEAIDCHAQAQALRELYQTLSHRERQVMALVTRGLLNKQVGYELGISEITVKAHRGRVMRKLNAKTIVELVHINTRLDLMNSEF